MQSVHEAMSFGNVWRQGCPNTMYEGCNMQFSWSTTQAHQMLGAYPCLLSKTFYFLEWSNSASKLIKYCGPNFFGPKLQYLPCKFIVMKFSLILNIYLVTPAGHSEALIPIFLFPFSRGKSPAAPQAPDGCHHHQHCFVSSLYVFMITSSSP